MLCLVLCTCTACTSLSKEETETSETETESEVSAYQNVLRKIRQNHMYPGSDTEFTEFDWEESLSIYYAIVDVNQDGIKELLLDFDYDSGPDGGITVYTYDPNAPTLVHEIGGFYTFSRFYDNGIVEEGISQTGKEVTAVVTSNFTRGDSCVCLMAESAGAQVFPVDIGVEKELCGR